VGCGLRAGSSLPGAPAMSEAAPGGIGPTGPGVQVLNLFNP